MIDEQGEPATGYKWTSLISQITGSEWKLQEMWN